jgi:hypothetical protein
VENLGNAGKLKKNQENKKKSRFNTHLFTDSKKKSSKKRHISNKLFSRKTFKTKAKQGRKIRRRLTDHVLKKAVGKTEKTRFAGKSRGEETKQNGPKYKFGSNLTV